jgi:translation initiation factor 3 subunit D
LLIDSVIQLSGGVEWRQKLDTQRGAVLANELRNNACKLAKWTVQALLAGSDQIKFGYVHLLITMVAGYGVDY